MVLFTRHSPLNIVLKALKAAVTIMIHFLEDTHLCTHTHVQKLIGMTLIGVHDMHTLQ